MAVNYRDNTHFEGDNHTVAELAEAIRTKMYGVDVREPIAQAVEKMENWTKGNNIGVITNTPTKTFADLEDLQNSYPNGADGVMVTVDDGHKYFWSNGQWTDGGVYQSAGVAERSIYANYLTGEAKTPLFFFNGNPRFDWANNKLYIPSGNVRKINDRGSVAIAQQTVDLPVSAGAWIYLNQAMKFTTTPPTDYQSNFESASVVGWYKNTNGADEGFIFGANIMYDVSWLQKRFQQKNINYYVGDDGEYAYFSNVNTPIFNFTSTGVSFVENNKDLAIWNDEGSRLHGKMDNNTGWKIDVTGSGLNQNFTCWLDFYNQTFHFKALGDLGHTSWINLGVISTFAPNFLENTSLKKTTFTLPYTINGAGSYNFSNADLTRKTNPLQGATLSVMGDSISTYSGYNKSEIDGYGGNIYPRADVQNVASMWWHRVAMNEGMRIGAVEANAGSSVSTANSERIPMSATSRVEALGENGTPDVIIIEGGTNDYLYNAPIGTWDGSSQPQNSGDFKEAYALMISKIQEQYPNALVYCSTIMPSYIDNHITITGNSPSFKNAQGTKLEDYNNAIRDVAEIYNCKIIDLNKVGFNVKNLASLTTDSSGTAIHPNKKGQLLMATRVMLDL